MREINDKKTADITYNKKTLMVDFENIEELKKIKNKINFVGTHYPK